MPPLLLGITDRGDGYAVWLWSVRPGWRVSLVAPANQDQDVTAAVMLAAIIPAIERRAQL